VHSDAFSAFDATNLSTLEKTLAQLRGKMPSPKGGKGEDSSYA